MRRSDREITSYNDILKIIGECKVLRLALCDNGLPYIVPLNFGYEKSGGGFTFYFHSAHEGKKLDIIKKSPSAAFEMDCSNLLTAENTDNPCTYGYNYRSIVGGGNAEIVTDTDEKKYALKLIMLHQTGKNFDFTDAQAKSVTIIKLTVKHLSAKARQ